VPSHSESANFPTRHEWIAEQLGSGWLECSTLFGRLALLSPALCHNQVVQAADQLLESIDREPARCIDKLASRIKDQRGGDIRYLHGTARAAAEVAGHKEIPPPLPGAVGLPDRSAVLAQIMLSEKSGMRQA